jgi:hypothetical protein
VRVAQAGEDLAFAGEALAQVGIGQSGAQQFQRHPPLVQAVGATRQPHLAHPALAQHAVELVRADHRVRLRHRRRRHQRFGKEILVVVLQRHQRLQLIGQRRVFLAQRFQPRPAAFGIEFE